MRRFLFLFVFLFLLISLIHNVMDYQNSIGFYALTKKNLDKAIEQNKELKIKKLVNSSSFEIEKNLRDKQNLSRENEVVIIVPQPSPSPVPLVTPPVPVFQQWLQVFF